MKTLKRVYLSIEYINENEHYMEVVLTMVALTPSAALEGISNVLIKLAGEPPIEKEIENALTEEIKKDWNPATQEFEK